MLSKSPTVRVLVATSCVEVHAALESIAPYQAQEAVTTRGVYHALPNVQLAVVEIDSLIEEEVSRATLVEILNRSPLPWTTPERFLADPTTWRAHALAAAGNFQSFPPATAALTSAAADPAGGPVGEMGSAACAAGITASASTPARAAAWNLVVSIMSTA